LQAVLKARALEPENPQVHKQTVKFLHIVGSQLDSLKPVVKNVIVGERDKILGGKSLESFNREFLQKFSSSLPHRHVAAELIFLLSNNSNEAVKLVSNLDDIRGHKKLKECIAIHQTISEVFGDKGAAEEYKKKCKALFPLATYFMEPAEVEQRKKEREELEKEEEKKPEAKQD